MTTKKNAKLASEPHFTLVSGVGDYSKGKACVVSAAVALWRYQRGEDLNGATDQLDCIDPAVRSLAIRINDANWWQSNTERTEVLSPFIARLAGTSKPELLRKRALLCADMAVRHLLPMRLDDIGTASSECRRKHDRRGSDLHVHGATAIKAAWAVRL